MLRAGQSRGQIPTVAKDSFGINPAPYSMGVGVLSPAMNHLGSEVDH